MNSSPETIPIDRYIGIDIHKYYVMVGGQNRRQEWILRPRRIQMNRFRDWAEKNFRMSDAVVIETTGSVWDVVAALDLFNRDAFSASTSALVTVFQGKEYTSSVVIDDMGFSRFERALRRASAMVFFAAWFCRLFKYIETGCSLISF